MPGIDKYVISASKPEGKMPVHLIPDEGERVRPNENSEKSSELTYLKKDSDVDTSAYEILLNALKKLDTS